MPNDTTGTAVAEPQNPQARQAIAIARGVGGALNIVPANMGEAIEFARLMSRAGDCVRPAFRDNPGACLSLALQAWRWGADPFAVANKAYITSGKAGTQIAYEAQLIHAIVNASPVLAKRLRPYYEGDGQNRRCKIVGWVRGEDEPLEYESPPISKIAVKNSPLWQGDPDQQLFYYSSRAWARRHVPEILLGIYTGDEVLDGDIIDVTADRLDDHAGSIGTQQQKPQPQDIPWQVCDHIGEVYEFERADRAIEACRRILALAASSDPKALATAYENNAGFLDDLSNEGLGEEREGIERLYRELAPKPEPQDTPKTEDEPTVEDQANLQKSQGGPGPIVTPSPDQPYTPADGGMQSPEKHDAFWDRSSLRLDPPPVKGAGDLKKLEWKGWPALVMPRLKQVWDVRLLNALWQDNHENLEKYETACGTRDKDELVALFDDARARLS